MRGLSPTGSHIGFLRTFETCNPRNSGFNWVRIARMGEYDALIAAAKQARENAHAPFSNFRVGAAVRAKSGRIFAGCNVENATLGLTCCAERVAIFKAVSEGEHGFESMAVVADTDVLTPPCGACRQIIWEFCGDVPVILTNLKGKIEETSSGILLPAPFDSSFL
ncbi:MAG: cytidine deaminase [Candidatus Acidiferrales bacterium]